MTTRLPDASRRHFVGMTAALAAALFAPRVALAADPDPAAAIGLVRETTGALLDAVKAIHQDGKTDPAQALALVDRHISPHVDLERSSRWVLGKHWRRATDEQKQRFIAEFRTLLLRTYALAVAENPEVAIEYLPARKTRRKNETIVRTRIPQRGAPPIAVNYRMHHGSGAWKLFDVSIEGISLVSTYRTSFTQRVKSRGIDGLIDDMAEKNRARRDA